MSTRWTRPFLGVALSFTTGVGLAQTVGPAERPAAMGREFVSQQSLETGDIAVIAPQVFGAVSANLAEASVLGSEHDSDGRSTILVMLSPPGGLLPGICHVGSIEVRLTPASNFVGAAKDGSLQGQFRVTGLEAVSRYIVVGPLEANPEDSEAACRNLKTAKTAFRSQVEFSEMFEAIKTLQAAKALAASDPELPFIAECEPGWGARERCTDARRVLADIRLDRVRGVTECMTKSKGACARVQRVVALGREWAIDVETERGGPVRLGIGPEVAIVLTSTHATGAPDSAR